MISSTFKRRIKFLLSSGLPPRLAGYSQSRSNPSKPCNRQKSITDWINWLRRPAVFTMREKAALPAFQPPIAMSVLRFLDLDFSALNLMYLIKYQQHLYMSDFKINGNTFKGSSSTIFCFVALQKWGSTLKRNNQQTPLFEGFIIQGSNQEVAKVVSLCINFKIIEMYTYTFQNQVAARQSFQADHFTALTKKHDQSPKCLDRDKLLLNFQFL